MVSNRRVASVRESDSVVRETYELGKLKLTALSTHVLIMGLCQASISLKMVYDLLEARQF